MGRSEARIFTRIWQDRDFTERPADVQRLYFLILSQPGLSLCGVVAHQPRRWARLAPDTSVKAVGKALDQLVEHRFVVVDDDTEELWVRSFVKNDAAVKNDNLLLALARDFEAIASGEIREGVTNAIAEALTKRFPNGPPDALVNRVLDRVGDGMLKAVAYAIPDGLLTRVRAQSPAPAPTPSPRAPATGSRTPSDPDGGALAGARDALKGGRAVPAGAGGEGEAWGAGDWTPSERERADGLVGVVLEVVPKAKPADARRLVTWAAAELDWGVVDEALGYCAQLDTAPQSVTYLATTIRNWGAQRGVKLPAFGRNGRG